MRTSQAQLQAAANEIASTLPKAPQIEPQVRQETGAFDPCATWPEGSPRTLFGQPDTAGVSPRPSRTSCAWTISFVRPSRTVVTVNLYIGEAPADAMAFFRNNGWSDVPDATYPTVT